MQENQSVSVIIPTLNAERYLPSLFQILKKQTHKIEEIIIVDSESTDRTVELAEAETGVKVIPVKRKNFDHGGTRNHAAENAKGEYLFFLSQDALPVDEYYIENMLTEFVQGNVMMVTARQIPYENAPEIEKLTRSFNYPANSFVRSNEDIERLGIKAYFFSDVCSAYRADFFREIGGFETPILTNEDMLMAARALKAEKRIGYAAEAKVYHSHKYTLKQQYKRNFDVAVFLQSHQDEIQSGSSTGEGIRMVLFIEKELLKKGKLGTMCWCILDSGAKFLGNRAGKRYEKISRKQILKRTSNPGYWRKLWDIKQTK